MVKPRWGAGRAFRFHGSYTSLILARRKERAIPGAFIHEKDGRYYVLQPKKIGNPLTTWTIRAKTKKAALAALHKEVGWRWYQVRSVKKSAPDTYLITIDTFELRNRRENPAKSTRGKASKRVAKIYGRVLRIEAQKVGPHHCDAECKRCKHKYFHDFKVGPEMIGLTPGQVFKVPAGCWPLLIMC